MTARVNPDQWTAPEWHPDFGDSALELSMLRTFAKLVLEMFPGKYEAELDAYEPGYMRVVFLGGSGTRFAELHVVDRGPERRYGLFLEAGEEKEHYFTSPGAGLRHFVPDAHSRPRVRVAQARPVPLGIK